VEKQSEDQKRQAETKKFKEAEDEGAVEVDKHLNKFGSEGKKIGFY
jgi:hypothetical protein